MRSRKNKVKAISFLENNSQLSESKLNTKFVLKLLQGKKSLLVLNLTKSIRKKFFLSLKRIVDTD